MILIHGAFINVLLRGGYNFVRALQITIPIGFSSCISTITRPHAASLRPLESGDMATSGAAVAPTEPSNSKPRHSWASGGAPSIHCGAEESPRPNVIVTGVDSI